MNYKVKKYPQGTFSWADVYSKDIEVTKKFLTNLFGWTAEDSTEAPYTMFMLDGDAVAGGSSQMGDENMPAMWSNYISVDNVDDMAKKAEELGGRVVMPAMDVLTAGRMVGIQDPTGAVVMLWQAKDHIGAGVVNKPGAMGWNELYTNDLEKAKEFYCNLLGWEYETDADMENYTIIKNRGRMNGGMMEITPEMGAMPPHWAVYFTVDNMDESIKKVEDNDGKVHKQFESEKIGKMAVVSEPTGAMFTIIEMKEGAEPEEWTE